MALLQRLTEHFLAVLEAPRRATHSRTTETNNALVPAAKGRGSQQAIPRGKPLWTETTIAVEAVGRVAAAAGR